jgi:hypothetical protein
MNKVKINLIVLLFFIIATFILLYPLSIKLTSSLPDIGDSLHNIWTWGDNINRINDPHRGLFDANILYPEKNVAVFAELQINNTILFYPFFKWLNNPILGHNIILLLAFILSGYFSYLIAYEFTNKHIFSALSGFIFTFFPYRFVHLFHVQLLCFQWVLIPLYFLIKYLKSSKSNYLILFFISFLWQTVSIGYNTVYLFLIILSYLLFVFVSYPDRVTRIKIYKVIGMILISVILALPFYLPYLIAEKAGYSRSISDFNEFGLDIQYLFSAPPINILYGSITKKLPVLPYLDVSPLFFGFTVLVLFIVSLQNAIKKINFKVISAESFTNLYLVIMALFFLLMMMGPSIKLQGTPLITNPIFLFYYIPVFHCIRFLPNFIHPFMFFAGILIAKFLSGIKYNNLSTPLYIGIILIMLIGVEYGCNINVAKTNVQHGENIPPSYKFLMSQRHYPVLELNVARINGSIRPWDQFIYMYYSIYHKMPLVNGMTGFTTNKWNKIWNVAREFPNPEANKFFQDIGVRYIIIHHKVSMSSYSGDWEYVNEKEKLDFYKRMDKYAELKKIYNDKECTIFLLN